MGITDSYRRFKLNHIAVLQYLNIEDVTNIQYYCVAPTYQILADFASIIAHVTRLYRYHVSLQVKIVVVLGMLQVTFGYVCIIISSTQSYILLYLLEMVRYEILSLLYVMTIAAFLVAIQKCFSSSGLVTKNYIPQKLHEYLIPCNFKTTGNGYLKQLKAVVG